jgi:isopropylmalate/homocitrate/citramalate synthase
MKDLIVAIALLTICAAPAPMLAAAHEQDAAPPQGAQAQAGQALERLEQLKARLKMTPEQVERVRPVLIEEAQKLKALREKADDTGESRRARRKLARELRAIQDRTDDQLKKVLSKEQMNELKKIREERREQLRDRAGRQ